MFKFITSIMMMVMLMVGVATAQTVTAVVKVCDDPNVQTTPYLGKGNWETSQGTVLSTGETLTLSGDMATPNNHYVFRMYNIDGTRVTGLYDWFTNEMNDSHDYNFNMVVLNACFLGVPGYYINPPYNHN